MSTPTRTGQSTTTVQIHRVYITAPAQRVWDAITSPEWSDRYGYGGIVDVDLRPGGRFVSYAGEGMQAVGVSGPFVDGEIVEADPPRRLVQTWRLVMDEDAKAEGFTRLTYELHEDAGVTRLTVLHDVSGAPLHGALVAGEGDDTSVGAGGGGWPWILSDLKSLLETGTAFTRADPA